MLYAIHFLIASCQYLRTVIIHRWALYLAAKKLGVSMRRVLHHDNSKFSWIEWRAHVRKFKMGINDPQEWAAAWEHHWRHNDHHIEYWRDHNLRYDYAGPIDNRFPDIGCWIPDDAVRELVTDWMAASYSYSGQWPKAGSWDWGNKNLVRELRKMEETGQPETTTRGLAVSILQKHGMITADQVTLAMWDDDAISPT